jgi:hypothetical protein
VRTIRIEVYGRTIRMHPDDYFALVAHELGCTPDEARAQFVPNAMVQWEDVEP